MRFAILIVLLAPMLVQSQTAVAQGGAISACLKFLKEYFFKPVAQGASEALGYQLVEKFMESQDDGKIPATVDPPSATQLAPRGEIDDGYIAYLKDMGLTDCQIRQAVRDSLGAPDAQVYN